MWEIIIIILIGMILLLAEFLLLPGVTVAGIISFCAYVYGIYKAFVLYGNMGGFIVMGISVLTAVIIILICLRTKSWQRFALRNKVEGSSQELPQEQDVKIGDKGTTLTRLAPMGKVFINGNYFEAKSIDSFIDEKKEIEVIGFENFSILVKKI